MMTPDEEKKQLRQLAAKRRKAAFDAMADAPQRIAAYHGLLSARYDTTAIAAYWPIRTEIDPIPLLEALCQAGGQGCLPVTPEEGQPLTFHHWISGSPLADGPYNTKEPFASSPIILPTLILAPLLAYDANCWRLGYGGGFYDRTLAALEQAGHHADVVGIAFDESCVYKVPTGPYDRQLSAILTPSGLIVPE